MITTEIIWKPRQNKRSNSAVIPKSEKQNTACLQDKIRQLEAEKAEALLEVRELIDEVMGLQAKLKEVEATRAGYHIMGVAKALDAYNKED